MILVGSVTENIAVGTPTEARRFPGVGLELRKASVQVEAVLSGDRIPDAISIYYFTQSQSLDFEPNPLYKILFKAQPGRRYLFFLTRERGEFRSIGDVGEYTIEVFAGTPTPALLQKQPSVGRKIAHVLLTPGEDVDLDRLAYNLVDAYRYAALFTRRTTVLTYLEALQGKSPHLDRAVCDELVRVYYGKSQCLERISSDPRQPPNLRQRAAQRLVDERQEDIDLLARLKQGYMFADTFNGIMWPDSYAANRIELQLLADHPDAAVRSEASRLLQQFYPE
ncbi:MAG: hypothetical protein U0Q18_37705 [Bryobacteraceae bacterium]